MSQRRIVFLRECMASLSNHWTFFSLVLVYAAVTTLSPADLIGFLLVGFLPAILFWAREVVQSTILQFCCYPVFIGLIFFLPIEPESLKGVYFFFATVYLLFSLYRTITGRGIMTKILPPFVCLGINFFISIFLFPHMEIYRVPFLLFFGISLTCLFYFGAYYLDQFLIFVKKNEGTSHSMPRNEIFRSGMRLSLLYLGFSGILLFIISSFSITEEFLHRFWGRVRGLIRTVLEYLLSHAGNDASQGTDPVGEPLLFPWETELTQRPPTFWEKLTEYFLFMAVIVVLILFFVSLIRKLIGVLKRLMPQKNVIFEEEETEDLDIHENLSQKEGLFEQNEDDSRFSPKQKIRRIFRRRALLSKLEQKRLSYYTARDVALSDQNPLLATLYEKARYSNLECDKEDVKCLRQSYRRSSSNHNQS